MEINAVSMAGFNHHDDETNCSVTKKANVPYEMDNIAIQFMMQQFMNDMYSPVDECSFSVNYKPEW